MGPKDIEEIKHNDNLINTIVTRLKSQNKINPNYKSDFKKLDTLLQYSDLCAHSLAHWEGAITKDNYSNYYLLANDLQKHGIANHDVMNIYASLIFNQFVLLYGHLGNILITLLTGAKWENKARGKLEKITGKETLGTLINAVKSLTSVDLEGEVVDSIFRNALAHGYYWISDDKIHYFVDGTLKNSISISVEDLFRKQIRLWHFVSRWSHFVDSL